MHAEVSAQHREQVDNVIDEFIELILVVRNGASVYEKNASVVCAKHASGPFPSQRLVPACVARGLALVVVHILPLRHLPRQNPLDIVSGLVGDAVPATGISETDVILVIRQQEVALRKF